MPTPRKALVSHEITPYYHCVSRCVRRAYLCGTDKISGQSFEHRRGWIEQRLLHLSTIFSLDVCAYAVMSNHYHVVLHIDQTKSENWSFQEVIHRWHQLFKSHELSQQYCNGIILSSIEYDVLKKLVNTWRSRLTNISWFMRVLNEKIAREANKEDGCTGRFWEGRFKSQALLDEQALLSCMAYVDLNPLRANIAKKPEESDYTAVKLRCIKAKQTKSANHPHQQAEPLMPFAGYPRPSIPKGLPFQLTDYLELIDWTGQIVRSEKHNQIKNTSPPILERLHLTTNQWCYLTMHFESCFRNLVGATKALKSACKHLNKKWVHGLRHSEALFPNIT